ncbi:SapC family protein [Xanthomonas sp. WHRI 7945]|nr:SapC family protein [Xanthomonas campestris pv. campestris]
MTSETMDAAATSPTDHAAGAPPHAGTPPQPAASPWPMFYRRPVLLSSHDHADWRVRPAGVGFAARSHSVPVVAGEFAAASRCYPLVFAGNDYMPMALLGLQADSNRFVDGEAWAAGSYVPAYVRRYPFVFVQMDEPEGYALAIDAEADMVVASGEEGLALFEGGQPSELTRQALQFCEAFTREDRATRQFTAQLAAQGLLLERTANITFPDGRKASIDGFHVVDTEKFATLSEEVIVQWHRNGWLSLVHFHLASLARFTDLMAR